MNAPTDAECNDRAVAFDILQVQVKTLDQLLHNMADIDDMVDELDDAAKKAGDDHRDAKAHRQARAYKLTQIVLTAAMEQHQLIEEQWPRSWHPLPTSRATLRGGSRRRRPHGSGASQAPKTRPGPVPGLFFVCRSASSDCL